MKHMCILNEQILPEGRCSEVGFRDPPYDSPKYDLHHSPIDDDDVNLILIMMMFT